MSLSRQNATKIAATCFALAIIFAVPGCPDTAAPTGGISYGLQVSAVGLFAPLGAGDPVDPAVQSFGPIAGYETPAVVLETDVGDIERGTFITVASMVGDLTAMTARILQSDEVVETLLPDALSVAAEIGFRIPFTLDTGSYIFEVTTPNGLTIARIRFAVEDVIFKRTEEDALDDKSFLP